MILLALAILMHPPALPLMANPSQEAPKECVADSTCPYGCCLQTPGYPCFCSACCVSALDAGGGEIYWSGDRVAVLKRRSIEFYRAPKGALPYVNVSSTSARPLSEAVLPRGALSFRDASGGLVLAGARTRSFDGDLLPPGHPSGMRSAFLVCTSSSTGFCGVLHVDGREMYRLKRPARGALNPVGLAGDGSEALLAVIVAEPRREITGYLIRRKNGTQEVLGGQDPEVERLMDRFQGPLVMPTP